ncbi:acyltransferase family protein [Glycomyces harbinensis]|uniref:Peptidoglycan/LPS O-acetylase OafA/YrhL, contains acyltransferase and SGNH-hydrolase domains n=1 Tax=Glycomyces harbinensis TaxID=58114 RepID=A0A1G7CQQ7_9ACTN|nr:acyltransferase family protein [Glycomyces harbinensis]SDE41100.1 Peptidoglycan/LPS O-acetylase OafA/YrhL, contains acyltransferase and SGNH-hydrolase domains [Glycomyces harbinensis]
MSRLDSDTLLLPRVAAEAEPAERERWDGMGFRPDIQGLRAIAVGLVLLSHAGFFYSAGGYVGVDVFFVLSGFLITSLLVKEVFESRKISIAGFYARRARRILPAAMAVTIATALGAWLFFPVTRLEAVMQDALAVIVYIVNYRFVAEQTEYLNADQMPSPFQQFWSLAVEEQFYVVWPVLLLVLLLLVGRKPGRLVKAGIVFSVIIFAATLALSVIITEQSQPTAYYAAHTRAWELAAGAFLALTLPQLKKTPAALAWLLGIGGLAAIIASGFLYTEATPFPGYAALAPVLGTVAVIIAGSSASRNPVSSLLGTGPFQFVGKISYSLYLWHWPILILAPLALDVEPTLMLNLILLTATVAIAQLSYQYIEEPMRNWKPVKRSNGAGLLLGFACSVLGVATVLALTQVFPKTENADETVDLQAVEQAEDQTALEARLQEGLDVTTVPADLAPPLAGMNADRPETYADGCHLDFDQTDQPDDCAYGDTESDTTVVLFGDSHAAQWFPALETIAEQEGWNLISRTKSSCTSVMVHVGSTQSEGEYTECWDWKQNVFDEIDEVEPALVIFGSTNNATPLGEDDPAAAWADGWTESLDRAGESAANVAVLTDTPWATGEAAPDCLSLHMDAADECVEGDPYALSHLELRESALEAQEASDAVVVDTEPWFCLSEGCPLIVDGLAVYRDKHHISTPYAVSLSTVLAQALPDLA